MLTQPSRSPQPPTVLYVGGFSRSGSTLLAYLLATIAGSCPVGELREVWTKGLIDDTLCTCGERFSACHFWTAVGQRAFGGWENVDAEELAATSHALATDTRLVPTMLAGRSSGGKLNRFGEHAARLYETIAETTGCSLVIDSSKVAPYAMLLARDGRIRLRVIQLVRDSRAVAFAWAKQGVVKPDVEGGLTTMDTYGMGATAARWCYHNVLFDCFLRGRVPIATLRYEDLACHPAQRLESALAGIGLALDDRARSQLDSGSVSVGNGHWIGGNPMRFRGGTQAIRLDEEWRAAMPRATRARLTALTWPLLARYGYLPAAAR